MRGKAATFLAVATAGLVMSPMSLAGDSMAFKVVADQGTVLQTVRVAYADLNLARDAGINQLYARLRIAAATACDDTGDIRELISRNAFGLVRECKARTLDDAVAQVGGPKLAEKHLMATHRGASDVALAANRD